MNRRTFLKGVGLSLLACVVPNIVKVEEEKDGLYYELARSPLYPNTDTDNKFDGISHLIDKDG